MGIKYNRALDLMAAAAVFSQQGNVVKAAKAFTEACSDPSMASALKVIEASNSKAYKAIKAEGIPADEPGEDFRVEPDVNSGDREVQEAGAARAKSLRAKARRLLAEADAMEEGDGDADADDLTIESDADEMPPEDGEDFDVGDLDETATAVPAVARAKATAKAAPKSGPVTAKSFARAVHNLNALSK